VRLPSGAKPVHLLIDSTGLTLCGGGEWLVEKHGSTRRRSWRKLHIGIDANTGQILAALLTPKEVDDASQIGTLLDRTDNPIAAAIADGAYGHDTVYADVAARHPAAAVVVPPRATAVLSINAGATPTQRDRHRRVIAKHGCMGWQKASGYNQRARVETSIERYKQVIGDGLRSRKDDHRATEVGTAVTVLNRMLTLGRPHYVRVP
jgi:hypothetical protein